MHAVLLQAKAYGFLARTLRNLLYLAHKIEKGVINYWGFYGAIFLIFLTIRNKSSLKNLYLNILFNLNK